MFKGNKDDILLGGGYVFLEITCGLLSENLYLYTEDRKNPIISFQLIVLFMEVAKLLVALCFVLASTRNFSLDKIHYFVIQAVLYYLNNCIYYYTLRIASAGSVAFLYICTPLSLSLSRIPSLSLISLNTLVCTK
jgi:hypothetical protein